MGFLSTLLLIYYLNYDLISHIDNYDYVSNNIINTVAEDYYSSKECSQHNILNFLGDFFKRDYIPSKYVKPSIYIIDVINQNNLNNNFETVEFRYGKELQRNQDYRNFVIVLDNIVNFINQLDKPTG